MISADGTFVRIASTYDDHCLNASSESIGGPTILVTQSAKDSRASGRTKTIVLFAAFVIFDPNRTFVSTTFDAFNCLAFGGDCFV
jgi:hypothetical protein